MKLRAKLNPISPLAVSRDIAVVSTLVIPLMFAPSIMAMPSSANALLKLETRARETPPHASLRTSHRCLEVRRSECLDEVSELLVLRFYGTRCEADYYRDDEYRFANRDTRDRVE